MQNPLSYNSTELIATTVLVIISQYEPHRKHDSSIVAFMSIGMGTWLSSCFPVMTEAWTTEHTIPLLPHTCCRHYLVMAAVYSHCLATGLYTTIYTGNTNGFYIQISTNETIIIFNRVQLTYLTLLHWWTVSSEPSTQSLDPSQSKVVSMHWPEAHWNFEVLIRNATH
jgi:hypothetical protein